MVNVNDFCRKTDNETIEAAIAAKGEDGIVVVPPRVSSEEPERDYWLLDRAIILPENTTLVLRNSTLKLSDKCRDNFIRSANCGLGIEDPAPIKNIHVRGEGMCTLLGADHPRAVGDSSKVLANPCPYNREDLAEYAYWIPEDVRKKGDFSFVDFHDHSYGTDAGKEGKSQYGDWRGIGILLANCRNFSVSNLRIVESHGWAISLEACSYGRIEKIEFDACMSKVIDGFRNNMENQDGIDIRNGCHHIVVSDITGQTGDDVVALTAIADRDYYPGGSLRCTHVMHSDWTRRERDIHDIVIRNVIAHSNLCWTVRLLPVEAHIWNVVIDGIIDTAPDDLPHEGGILLGEGDAAYGVNYPDGLKNIMISNCTSNGRHVVNVGGYLCDSVITNLVNRNPKNDAVKAYKPNGLKNVVMSNIVTTAE